MTRRAFLQASGSAAGSAWLALQAPAVMAAAQAAVAARDAGRPFEHLTAEEAAGIEAMAARIIPTDDTPGAREMGVVFFVDQALGGFMAGEAGSLRDGTASLDALAAKAHGSAFAELAPEAQDELLRRIEDTPFFGLVHFLTVAGALALPSYGGNRGYLGWQLIGFEHRHAWLPPFGHYDAELMEQEPPEPGGPGGHDHG
ncbi:MAG: gluconate 2-dehydrogenase subunit 3 family protein [Gammaproteobacteria bacterium]|jgi:gluconate 2-dehydrogenase gamma chain